MNKRHVVILTAAGVAAVVLFPVQTTIHRYRTIEKDTVLVHPKVVSRETEWHVVWYALDGELKKAGKVGIDTFPSTFSWSWGMGEIFQGRKNYIEFTAKSEIYAPRSGLYWFKVGSDDGARLWIDGEVVLTNQWKYGGRYREQRKKIMLKKGKHTLRLDYWERTRFASILFDCSPELLTWEDTIYETTITKVTDTIQVMDTVWVPLILKVTTLTQPQTQGGST